MSALRAAICLLSLSEIQDAELPDIGASVWLASWLSRMCR